MPTRLAALVLAALAPLSSAQDLLIPDVTNGRLMRFDAATGALIDANAIEVSAVSNGLVTRPSEVLFAPNGELWMADAVTDAIERFSGDGSSYLGFIDVGATDIDGGAVLGDSVWIAKAAVGFGFNDSELLQLDATGAIVGAFPAQIPSDVEPYRFQGVDGLLMVEDQGDRIMFVDADAATSQTPFFPGAQVTLPWQAHATASGRVWLVDSHTNHRLWELDASGAVLAEIDLAPFGLTGGRGVHELPSGDVLFTSAEGVHVLNRSAGTVSTVWSGGAAYYISAETTGTTYCTGELNSSGSPASLSARGSRAATDDDMTLHCRTMPMNATAFFITSRQDGFTANPVGSAGNLCLSGAIGRFTGPGQIQFSGTEGAISLEVDLQNHPTPNGLVQVVAGETWYYQCWFRDSASGLPTSNFSNGVGVTFL